MTATDATTEVDYPRITPQEASALASDAEDITIRLHGFLAVLHFMADGAHNTELGDALHTVANSMSVDLNLMEEVRERIWRGLKPPTALSATSEEVDVGFAKGLSMESERTLHCVSADLTNLAHALEAARRMLVEADGYVKPNGERNRELDCIAGLVAIAADTAARLSDELDDMTVTYVHKNEATETSTGA